jgi:hypothetical protein
MSVKAGRPLSATATSVLKRFWLIAVCVEHALKVGLVLTVQA